MPSVGGKRKRGVNAWSVPLVPASNVGGNTTDLRGAAGRFVGIGKLLSTGLEVVVPAEPATVASVDVHNDVGKVQRLESVRDTLTVAGGGVLACLEVDVGDEVGERVRLDDEGESLVGVGLDDLSNG